jgi:dCMP deaminase
MPKKSLIAVDFGIHWHHRFMARAKEIATWSKDPRVQVGAVIVNTEKTEVASGYNGFPRETPDRPEFYQDPHYIKENIIHAEVNALINALRNQTRIRDCFLYVTRPPCSRCSAILKQSGITEIVSIPQPAAYWAEEGRSREKLLQRFHLLGLTYYELREDRLEPCLWTQEDNSHE